MAKNNIRSIRFSDELAELIDQQYGETFTQKFENLITRCVWELPAQEKRLEEVKAMIAEKRKELYDLQRATERLHDLEATLRTTENYFKMVERKAKEIAEM